MNVGVVLLISLGCLALGYGFYSRRIARYLGVDPERRTPAHLLNDGVDYVPTRPLILFGHHFSSIAGAGPIVGPIIAGIAFGWGPALLWILVGAIFVGGVHDFSALMASVRHKGRTIGQICKEYLSPPTYYMFLVFTWMAMIYVIIAFLDLTASSFAPAAEELRQQGGTVATASVMYTAIAVLFGIAVYRLGMSVGKASLIFVPLVFGAIWFGHVFPLTAEMLPATAGSAKNTWSILLLVYCFAASVLPVWVLLQPRDYLSAFLLFGCLAGGIIGIFFTGARGEVTIQYPIFTSVRAAQLGYLYPALFITIACGAISGFHSLVASGTTSKQLDNECSARPVAYGGMLTEGALAVVALSSVMILAARPGLAENPVAIFASGIGRFLSVFGLSERVGATFGLLAVSAFLLTTLDTCTRLGRFIFEELLGLRGAAGRLFGTAATLAVPSIMVFVEIPGPQGQPVPAWRAVWPAFGATNQLLGALALLVVFTWLRHTGRRAGYVLAPMLFMCATTLTALVQLTVQNLFGPGSLFVGGISFVLALLAVAVIGNAVWRLRAKPARDVQLERPVTETVGRDVS
jgi:carbon starvation protein